MDYTNLFRSDLIGIEQKFPSQLSMFEEISDILYAKGFVTKTFKRAIIEREKLYPTGLITKTINFAIPHTDVEHVKSPFIYVLKLTAAIPFIQMGTTDQKIEVNNVFFLGIKQPAKQVGLLSIIMEKLQNEIFIREFNRITTKNDMESYLKNNFRSDTK